MSDHFRSKAKRVRTPLEIIADRPALAQGYAIAALRGPTVEGEVGRHQWVAWANTVFVKPMACDCWFCEHKREKNQ